MILRDRLATLRVIASESEAIHTYGDRWITSLQSVSLRVASSLRMAPLLAMTRGASVGLLAVANGVVGEVLRGFRAGHTVLDGDGLHPGVVGQREGFAVEGALSRRGAAIGGVTDFGTVRAGDGHLGRLGESRRLMRMPRSVLRLPLARRAVRPTSPSMPATWAASFILARWLIWAGVRGLATVG